MYSKSFPCANVQYRIKSKYVYHREQGDSNAGSGAKGAESSLIMGTVFSSWTAQ